MTASGRAARLRLVCCVVSMAAPACGEVPGTDGATSDTTTVATTGMGSVGQPCVPSDNRPDCIDGTTGADAPTTPEPDTGFDTTAGSDASVGSSGTSPATATTASPDAIDAGTDSATDSSAEGSIDATPGESEPNKQALSPVTDYSQPGPFATTVEADVGPSDGYTLFRPDPLGTDGFVHSPIIFGPGILTSAGNYTAFLTHLASHGFVVLSVNSMSGGPGAESNLDAMRTGLDWLLAQHSQPGVFEGKLAIERAITMGYSIGATASVELSSHEAIMTSVVIHGHNTAGDPRGPVLMITGTSDVIDDMRQTLSTLEEVPAVLVALPIGHLDVLGELAMFNDAISPDARYIAPITAWLRYWVNGDEGAKRFFWGTDCEMCSTPWIPPEPNERWEAQRL